MPPKEKALSPSGKPVPNNGHVCFNAAEAKALDELLGHEKKYAKQFKLNMNEMTSSRNPILGEPTPREGEGEPIISEAPLSYSAEILSKRVVKGAYTSLLSLCHSPLCFRPTLPATHLSTSNLYMYFPPLICLEIPHKIGTRPEKYSILGNDRKHDLKERVAPKAPPGVDRAREEIFLDPNKKY